MPGVSVDLREPAAIFAGGFLGAVARAELVEALPQDAGAWPWATFVANIAGALILGYAVTRLQRRPPPTPYRRSFIATGFCGALTTFSTMQLELLRMLDGGDLALAAAYATASVAVGLAAVTVASRFAQQGGPTT
jgi:CrcB protein